jgi:hypothetical protein
MVLSNCAVDAVSVYPTYRKPFDMIFERAKTEEWWAWVDLNHRPHPYQLSPRHCRWSATVCYLVDFPQ